MALTLCRECNEPLSTEAKACPHCGGSTPRGAKTTEYRTAAGVVLLVAAIIIWATVWKSGVLMDLFPGIFR